MRLCRFFCVSVCMVWIYFSWSAVLIEVLLQPVTKSNPIVKCFVVICSFVGGKSLPYRLPCCWVQYQQRHKLSQEKKGGVSKLYAQGCAQ